MSELFDLYQEVILDHNKRPRNFGKLDDADCTARGHNPLCGDQLDLYVRLSGELKNDGAGNSRTQMWMRVDRPKGKPGFKDEFRRIYGFSSAPARSAYGRCSDCAARNGRRCTRPGPRRDLLP